MARLYTELTSHGNKRVLKRADDTRIMLDVYHKNKKVGTLGIYQVHDNDTINIVWDTGGPWTPDQHYIVKESKQLK